MFCTFGDTLMGKIAALCLLGTGIASLLLAVGYVLACWREGSRSTRKTKSPPEASIPISDAHYAALRAEMAELYSTLEKLTTTVTRLSSRQGMRDVRARATNADPPPTGTSKAELRKFYNVNGLSPKQFAERQLELGSN